MMALSLSDSKEAEYRWYIGENIGSVGLWRRRDGVEFPIYQNTRGQAIWHTAEVKTTQDEREPTDAFWKALSDLGAEGVMEIDVADCEWYERECVESLISMVEQGRQTEEMGVLLRAADRRVNTNE